MEWLPVSLPKKKATDKRSLTQEELKRFIDAAKDERLYAAFYLLLVTGMRRGEALGLKWSDIDLEKGTLTIQRSLRKTNTQKQQLAETKTPASRRAMPLDSRVVEVLREHQVRQQAEKELIGSDYQDLNMVFCREDGYLLYPDVLNKIMGRVLKKAQIEHISVHELRHTFASLQAANGTPVKTLQDMLGHATSRMTLDVYTHANDLQTKRAASTIVDLLDQSPEK